MEFENNKVEWLEYDSLLEYSQLFHGTFLRHGGTSEGAYESLNASTSIGDHPDCVKVNREMIRKSINVDKIIYANQVHGTKIIEVTQENKDAHHEADVLFTREKNIGLAMTHADCQAAIFYDPEKEVIAIAHAGWRGLMKEIYKDVIQFFKKHVGSNPEKIKVCISPSLGPDHAQFLNYKEEILEKYWDFQDKPKYFDLWGIAKKQLLECDILDSNIEIPRICTFTNKRDYYSYRRDKVTGRHATIIAIKP